MRKCPFCLREVGEKDSICWKCRAMLPGEGEKDKKEEPVAVPRRNKNKEMKEHGT